ncbi:hypothetical protein IF2G_05441 [Cordyceps javanica]|nr:hypothetical protein IF2G_05441 [Cordyceps javanica]
MAHKYHDQPTARGALCRRRGPASLGSRLGRNTKGGASRGVAACISQAVRWKPLVGNRDHGKWKQFLHGQIRPNAKCEMWPAMAPSSVTLASERGIPYHKLGAEWYLLQEASRNSSALAEVPSTELSLPVRHLTLGSWQPASNWPLSVRKHSGARRRQFGKRTLTIPSSKCHHRFSFLQLSDVPSFPSSVSRLCRYIRLPDRTSYYIPQPTSYIAVPTYSTIAPASVALIPAFHY